MASKNLHLNDEAWKRGNPAWTLLRLRVAAGFDDRDDFARVAGIPKDDYLLYEARADGPEKEVPLADAWRIADKLHCSLDHVYGRMKADEPAPGTLDAFYQGLTYESRVLFLELCDVVVRHDQRLRAGEGANR